MILLNQPVDMNGVDIPIDTCCLYDECGNEHEVKEWVYNQTTKVWTFKSDDLDDHDLQALGRDARSRIHDTQQLD